MFPAVKNKRALNIAWVSKWNRASVWRPRPRLVIITPSCLKVERAIIFFRSVSAVALIPAMSMVILASISVSGQNQGVLERKG